MSDDGNVTSMVERMLSIQAEYEAAERADEEPAITFRDQAALDEYVAGALEAGACPQGIHGWHQPAPNGLCPWCEGEALTNPAAPVKPRTHTDAENGETHE